MNVIIWGGYEWLKYGLNPHPPEWRMSASQVNPYLSYEVNILI